MIVDDSQAQVDVLRRVLEHDGYHCSSVGRGDTAFDHIVAEVPDVVVLDVELPGVDGLSVCRRLKTEEQTRLIPVLIMTGSADHRRRVQAAEAGADDFLEKPIGLGELRARVQSAARLKKYIDELDHAAASLVILGSTIEARDPYTRGHCERLADLGVRLGRRAGLGTEDLWALERGGFLHDLGKIAVPDAILFKPSSLTRDELEIVRQHPVVGERICMPLRTLERVRPIIRHHHELLDGSGYPDRLRGSQVPLLAQILAIADVWDALTTDRPYRRAMDRGAAQEILCGQARSGLRDRTLVQEFIAELGHGLPACA